MYYNDDEDDEIQEWKKLLLTWIGWLLIVGLASVLTPQVYGQTVVLVQPDCQVFFTLTAAGSGTTYDNRYNGCSVWSVSYNNTGFSGLTFAVQSAPNSSGSAGTWVTFAGTTVTGSNPATATTSAYWTGTGYYPFMRVNLSGTTGTGTVSGTLYGWRQDPSSISGGGSGGCSDPCTVVGPAADGAAVSGNPVRIGGKDSSGNTQDILTSTTGRPLNIPATTALAMADDISNTFSVFNGADSADASSTTPSQRGLPYWFDGTTWDRARGDSTSGGWVQGAAGNGTSAVGNPLNVARDTSNNIRFIQTDTSGAPLAATSSNAQADGRSNSPFTPLGSGGNVMTYPMYNYVLNGTNLTWDRSYKCDLTAAFDITGSTTAQIVALTAAQSIRVCHISLAGSSAADVTIVRGTGTNCGTGTTGISGTYKTITTLALDWPSPSQLVVTSANALCLTVTAGTWGGIVSYTKF